MEKQLKAHKKTSNNSQKDVIDGAIRAQFIGIYAGAVVEFKCFYFVFIT